jgi:uracil-DNA glycosylase family 4
MSAWTDHVAKWKDCKQCPLCSQRDRICLARGTIPADVCLIGEAPGSSEDALGQPFVGPAGNLLDQIIARALPATVTYVMTNLVCCFPAEAKAEGINEPHLSEIKACRPRLVEFINICRPKLIVCVGRLAEEYVDHGDTVRCIDITHPAAILRFPLAQKQMAAQKCIVVIRNAVEFMLASDYTFTKWGERHANLTPRDRLRTQLDQAIDVAEHTEADIPF